MRTRSIAKRLGSAAKRLGSAAKPFRSGPDRVRAVAIVRRALEIRSPFTPGADSSRSKPKVVRPYAALVSREIDPAKGEVDADVHDAEPSCQKPDPFGSEWNRFALDLNPSCSGVEVFYRNERSVNASEGSVNASEAAIDSGESSVSSGGGPDECGESCENSIIAQSDPVRGRNQLRGALKML